MLKPVRFKYPAKTSDVWKRGEIRVLGFLQTGCFKLQQPQTSSKSSNWLSLPVPCPCGVAWVRLEDLPWLCSGTSNTGESSQKGLVLPPWLYLPVFTCIGPVFTRTTPVRDPYKGCISPVQGMDEGFRSCRRVFPGSEARSMRAGRAKIRFESVGGIGFMCVIRD
jgi:hypothetical protein